MIVYDIVRRKDIFITSRMMNSTIMLIVISVLLIIGVSYGDILRGDAPRDYMLMNWVALPCYILLFIMLLNLKSLDFFNNRILQYFSKISYAFFLAQLFVWSLSYHILVKWGGMDNNLLRIVVSFTICTSIAIFLHECIEKTIKSIIKMQLK